MCDFTHIRKVSFMRYSLSSLFQIGKFGEICVINIITKAQGKVECNHGWPETCGHSEQVNNSELLKTNIIETSSKLDRAGEPF